MANLTITHAEMVSSSQWHKYFMQMNPFQIIEQHGTELQNRKINAFSFAF